MVIFEKVDPLRILEFEDWQRRINSTNANFPGFVAVSSKKLETTENEYCTVVQFDTPENLKRLLDSNELKTLLNEVTSYLVDKPKISHHEGLDIFFDKQSRNRNHPYYKKVILGIIAVYPLIIGVSTLYSKIIPGYGDFPFPVALFLEVIVVSALMTWPVMPFLSKVFRNK
ncbi:MAG: hypothetical protein ABJG78_08755 [Cyclobacteriaceae bacterium]